MSLLRLDVDDRQVVMHTAGAVCASTQELVESESVRARPRALRHLDHDPGAHDLGWPLAELRRRAAGRPATRAARPAPPAGQQPARARGAHRRARPATCSRAASACTSSSRACTTSGAAGTASSSCAPRCRRRRATSARCAASTRPSSRSAGWSATLYRDVAENVTGGRPRVTARSRPAPRWACTPCARSGRRRLATASCWPASPSCATCCMYPPLLLDPPTNTRTGAVHRGRRQPARRAHARARGVALLPGAGRAARSSSSTSTSASRASA